MLRKIINIDEDKCDGCGNCVPACAEGALQIIDGKARLISDLFCDGLGACIGDCPTGAISIVEREAEPYDERKVMDYIVKGGSNVIKAHLEHLRDHEEFDYVVIALEYLQENGIPNPITSQETEKPEHNHHHAGGCPGSKTMSFEAPLDSENESGKRISHLQQWPVQLHLVPPTAPYYKNSHLLLAADCCGFTIPDFHKDFLQGKSLAIACPKLDSNQEVYIGKLASMINDSNLRAITVLIMQVPCCRGLVQLVQKAVDTAGKEIAIDIVVVGMTGEILQEVTLA
ncbi:MAG: 4Fe-4S ferredoxin [Ignavibacteriae bacterium HGW-Ignavibacteriae-2]|jgi:ferredoxin|nr:MAG: 4Fe-4S ferredoxin [Ignavibacteriae bacterium HGW-Ignavibacteriae-2]